MAPVASAYHCECNRLIANRKLHIPVCVDLLDRWIFLQKVDRGRRDKGRRANNLIRRWTDEKVGDKRLIDPIATVWRNENTITATPTVIATAAASDAIVTELRNRVRPRFCAARRGPSLDEPSPSPPVKSER